MTISELVDEHRVLHQQQQQGAGAEAMRLPPSVAGLYQSTHALFAKPCNSIGPVVAALVLGSDAATKGRHGHAPKLEGGATTSTVHGGDVAPPSSSVADVAVSACFYLVCLAPMISALVQWAAWRGYSLKGRRLQEVQATMRHLHRLSNAPTPPRSSREPRGIVAGHSEGGEKSVDHYAP